MHDGISFSGLMFVTIRCSYASEASALKIVVKFMYHFQWYMVCSHSSFLFVGDSRFASKKCSMLGK